MSTDREALQQISLICAAQLGTPVVPPVTPPVTPPGVVPVPFPDWGSSASGNQLNYSAGVVYAYAIPKGSHGQIGFDFVSGTVNAEIAISKVAGDFAGAKAHSQPSGGFGGVPVFPFWLQLTTTAGGLAWQSGAPQSSTAFIPPGEQWYISIRMTQPTSGQVLVQTSGA